MSDPRHAIVEAALEAFWATVAARVPEAKSGDFPPDADSAIERAAYEAVTTWLLLNAPPKLPPIGARVRLRRDVERYPHFIARAGMVGTVTEADADSGVSVKLDEHLDGAEEWENQVKWYGVEEVIDIGHELERIGS
jgi:hypothetical protein